MFEGKVIGGHFLGGTVRKATFGSDLVIQSGLSGRKLVAENVAKWEDDSVESNSGVVSTVGQAVAKAVLPPPFKKAGAAAVGATVDSKLKPSRIVRVDWADGKSSLVKLPADQYVHLSLVLADRRVIPEVAESPADSRDLVGRDSPTVTEQAFALASSAVGKIPTKNAPPDIAEQIKSLASLRDAGVLTDEEFTAKKTELLARL